MQHEFEKEEQAIKAKSKQMTDARSKALQERERKRAEQRSRLEVGGAVQVEESSSDP